MIEISPRDRRFEVPGRGPCVEVVDNATAAVLLQKEEWERQDIASNLWRSVRNYIRESLLRENPDWSEEQVRQEIARRLGRGMG
jgi:hypothetical protein